MFLAPILGSLEEPRARNWPEQRYKGKGCFFKSALGMEKVGPYYLAPLSPTKLNNDSSMGCMWCWRGMYIWGHMYRTSLILDTCHSRTPKGPLVPLGYNCDLSLLRTPLSLPSEQQHLSNSLLNCSSAKHFI